VDFIEKGGWDRVKKRGKQRMEEEVSALESRKRGMLDLGPTADQLPWAGKGALGEVVSFLGTIFK
jgi:hypothetical protein